MPVCPAETAIINGVRFDYEIQQKDWNYLMHYVEF